MKDRYRWTQKTEPDWRDHLLGFILCAFYVMILVRTARNLGYSRDEGFYFDAARSYARWFEILVNNPREAMTRQSVDAHWATNNEHPALMKSLFALSWQYLHVKHKVFAEAGTAMRFPGMVMGGAALWLTFIMGARAYSRPASSARNASGSSSLPVAWRTVSGQGKERPERNRRSRR